MEKSSSFDLDMFIPAIFSSVFILASQTYLFFSIIFAYINDIAAFFSNEILYVVSIVCNLRRTWNTYFTQTKF